MAELRAEAACLPFETPVFCELLCEQSREQGRDDRQRGVQVAELALAALGPLAHHLESEELRRWQVKVWACVGNARCLALDYSGAEGAFAKAEGLGAAGEVADEVRAELLCYKSWLRCCQRRLAEAIELADDAAGLLPKRAGRLVVRVLLVRAQARSHLGQDDRALPDLYAALGFLEEGSDPLLRLTTHQNLAATLWRLGRLEEAGEWLERVRPMAAKLNKPVPSFHLLGFEGLLAAERGHLETALTRLRETCEGLRGIGKWDSFAVAALDLAQVELRCGAVEDAVDWVMQALPHLERLDLESDGLAALALLRQGVAAKQLSATVLAEARQHASRAAGVMSAPSGREP